MGIICEGKEGKTGMRKGGGKGKEEAIYVQISHQNIRETLSKALQKEILYHNEAPFN